MTKENRLEIKQKILRSMHNQVRGNTAGAVIAYSNTRTAQIVLSAMQGLSESECKQAHSFWENPIKYFTKEFKKYIKDAAIAKITALT